MVVNFNRQASYICYGRIWFSAEFVKLHVVYKMFADSNVIEFEFWKKTLDFSKKFKRKTVKDCNQFTKWLPPISTLRACWNSGGCSDFKWRHMLLVELLDRLIICPQRLHFELCLSWSCCLMKNFQTAEGVCPPPLAPPVLTMLTRRRGGFGVDFCFFADPFFIGVTSSFFPIWDWTKNRYLLLLKQELF